MTKTPNKPDAKTFHTIVKDDTLSAADLLAPVAKLPKQVIKQAMKKGAVWLTREKHTSRVRRAKKNLVMGDELHFYYDPAILDKTPLEAKLISDEGEYSIWYKPSGMLSQGSKWSDHCVINRVVEQQIDAKKPVFLVHRLDKAAKGLMILAHTKSTAAKLSKLFQEREIEKHYRATVRGNHSIRPQPETLTDPIDTREACSHVSCLQYDAKTNTSFLDVHIETGRKHQIRRHLAGIGMPVVGDRLYGHGDDSDDLQLTAHSLKFLCPITKAEKSYVLD
jgi:tRNA pseudouridine32 synthase / 23S rRNA pseudouridine746 synthase